MTETLYNHLPYPTSADLNRLNGSVTTSNDDIEMQPMNSSTSRTPLTPVTWQVAHMPADCCPKMISKQCSCCGKCIPKCLRNRWTYLRSRAHQFVEHRFFEWLIIGSILASSTTLVSRSKKHFHCIVSIKALEDINTRQDPIFYKVLVIFDKIFTVIFTIELILKWFAYGIKNYFTNGWNWLDFLIVIVSVLGLVLDLLGVPDISIFKSMRTLRALRPLKALSRFEGIRVRMHLRESINFSSVD